MNKHTTEAPDTSRHYVFFYEGGLILRSTGEREEIQANSKLELYQKVSETAERLEVPDEGRHNYMLHLYYGREKLHTGSLNNWGAGRLAPNTLEESKK